ncbi:MAG: ATP-dependent helicase [Myxococcales bacterium]|nr:ATP-dependent helicase [Myxococcales bacterium]
MQLTPTQRAAVEHSGGHLQLIACAGSGKTEVVARRIARMLDPSAADPCPPSGIVAFTFTDRAADELESRIHQRVREAYGSLIGMAELYVGTIHAFCRRLLQSEVSEFLRYSVLDGVGQRMLVAREPDRSGFSLAKTRDREPLSLEDSRSISAYLAALDVLRQGEVDRSRLGDNAIGEALERYRTLLRDESLIDYTGQLELALDLVRRDVEVGVKLAARVRHIIVDEYQDTNPLQESFVRALTEVTGARLTVVGDDDQTIYGFNGADIDNILAFSQRYASLAPVTTIRLEENFRSSRPVIEFARTFAESIERRLPKAMIATDAQPFEPGDLACATFRSRWDEARAIAQKILSLRGARFTQGTRERGLSWSDFAVLFRSGLHYNCNELLRVFDEEGVPYVVTGRRGLLGQRECLALRALFGFVAELPECTRAMVFSRFVESELVDTFAPIEAMLDHAERARATIDRSTLQDVLHDALDIARVRPRGDNDLRFANVGRFSSLVSQFERLWAQKPMRERLLGFVAYCDRSEREHEEASGVSELRAPDAVRVSTVHAAKGLEWPAVFVPRVETGQFPLKEREGAAWSIVGRDVVRNAARYAPGDSEERRLFYVAVTRAQRYLFVSAASSGTPSNPRPVDPSAFYQAFVSFDRTAKTLHRAHPRRETLEPAPRATTTELRLTFSALKPLFECAYRFELESQLGFCAPHAAAEGFGSAVHNALAEVHRRAIDGEIVGPELVRSFAERHLRLPFADEATRAKKQAWFERMLARYLRERREILSSIELVEKEIRVHFDDGVAVEGRIDLVLRRGSSEVSVVDLKSSEHAQSDALTDAQLLLYALGYEELTGAKAQRIERWQLDDLDERTSPVDDAGVTSVRALVERAATTLRSRTLPANPEPSRCAACAMRRVCASRSE